jgi:S1-C subfamily serine protease
MKRALILIVGFFIFGAVADCQNMLTRKEIYRSNFKAIVQISVNGNFSGVGFIASNDGIVITANHVVTTRESNFRQYAANITVIVEGNPTPYPATPINTQISDSQISRDSAILKIEASKLPHVTLGTLDEVSVGDSITVIPSWPKIGCIMLEGIVANKSNAQLLGPEPVNILLFQAPIRNGFSGSPIFNSKGHVVGIEDTKVFGISPALAELRTKWENTGGAGIYVGGASMGGSLLEIINNLDQNLISGLGSGVAIDYAKKQKADAEKSTTQR